MTREKIWRHIRTLRKSGYLRCESHIIEGLMNVAVPISDETGKVVCSMVVSSTNMRLAPERCEDIVRLIKEKTDP
jgi:DNA-binding IclR family transcriptional regulator